MKKIKMVDGGECRRCKVAGLVRKKTTKFKESAKYHFKEYLQCPSCKTLYMDEDKKFYPEVIPVNTLDIFWGNFGGVKNNGEGYSQEKKLEELIKASGEVIHRRSKTSILSTRERFDKVKYHRHGLKSHKNCFVCMGTAEIRHHIVSIKNGGRNSKRNLVSLCRPCHSDVHPWLK